MSMRTTCCGCWSALLKSFEGERRHGGRSYRRAKYNEREYSIEFENLIEEEDFYAPPDHAVSQIERDLLSKGKYDEFLQHQSKIDMERDAMLQKKEEDARLEDEAYIQAKKEASRVSRQSLNKKQPFDKSKISNARTLDSVEFSKWLSEEKIDITSPELDVEDFDAFLEKVKAKSAEAVRAKDVSKDDGMFDRTLSQGLEATKIAGDALSALQPVELHAASESLAEEEEEEINTPDVSFNIPSASILKKTTHIPSQASILEETTPSLITPEATTIATVNTPRNVAEHLKPGTTFSSQSDDVTSFKLVTPKERQTHSIYEDSQDEEEDDDFISANSGGGFEELLT
ncbi:uncharacterized protein LOC130647022 [Hydractinia symbiolongicarpus]|uniref:uncharacterized protein LOC130647022 n=1 Tax=Hydractinia symbiolongicarpus TaxID=13093 RepID=UPI00254A0774|nr:uncharacterized protein LOC130647022 [Hydractinia symbiolongicarpus]